MTKISTSVSRKTLVGNHKKKLIAKKKKKSELEKIKRVGHRCSTGNSKYKQGKFWSKKNRKEYVFRSAYEFAYFHILEDDVDVVSYIVEPFQVQYTYQGVRRTYWPDLLVLYKDGSMKIIEIKPLAFVKSKRVQAKAAGCRRFIKTNLKNTVYQFITEDDIFGSKEDYQRLVKLIK